MISSLPHVPHVAEAVEPLPAALPEPTAAAPSVWRQLARGRMPVPLFCVLALTAVTLLPPMAGAARLVPLLFPTVAVATACVLYARHPAHYVGFTWWIWFLAPAVRRIADYHTGWTPVSPIMVAPYLVTAVAALTLVRRGSVVATSHLVIFALPVTGILYAYVIGAGTVGAAPATFGLLTWIVPIIFGLHLAITWKSYPLWREVTESTFIFGAALLGIYGIIQYVVVPPWDAFWMQNADMSSIGWPLPYQVRVFGTLNAPGVYAMVLMAGLLLVLSRSRLSLHLATLPGWLGLLLSQVRSAWLGYALGLVLILCRLRLAQTLRLLGVAALVVGLLVPFVRVDAIAQTALPRLMSLTDVGSDHSFRVRLQLYRDFFHSTAGDNIAGSGIGSTNLATKLSNNGKLGDTGVIDSGIIEVLYVFGWVGSLLYLGGVALALLAVRSAAATRADPFVAAAAAIAVGCFVQIVFFNPFGGTVGMLFWSFVGLALAGQRYRAKAARMAA